MQSTEWDIFDDPDDPGTVLLSKNGPYLSRAEAVALSDALIAWRGWSR